MLRCHLGTVADEELCLIWRVIGHGGRRRDSVGCLLKLCNGEMSTGPHSKQRLLTRVCSRRESLSVGEGGERERNLHIHTYQICILYVNKYTHTPHMENVFQQFDSLSFHAALTRGFLCCSVNSLSFPQESDIPDKIWNAVDVGMEEPSLLFASCHSKTGGEASLKLLMGSICSVSPTLPFISSASSSPPNSQP